MKKRILVARFSALGDVVISLHVIKAAIEQNEDFEIVLLTKPFYRKLFENIDGVSCYDVDLRNKHKGFAGLKRLAKELSEEEFCCFLDLHNVLRTKLLRFFFGRKLNKFVIDKGRKEKKSLTRKKHKNLRQLKHTAQRYADVFKQAGFNLLLDKYSPNFKYKKSSELNQFLNNFKGKKIAIAPFAAHETKQYPIEKTTEILKRLDKAKVNVFIFGGGQKERKIAEDWQNEYENVTSLIGRFSLNDEIAIIDSCDKIFTMDSGNMHLASLTNTQIVSFWGGTHPFLGFTPFKKDDTIFVQKDIFCRPCSVFGNKKCYRDKMYCADIEPAEIADLLLND